MKKRVCLLVMLLALVIMGFSMNAMNVEAAEIIDRGYCGGEGDGKNLTWMLDSDGVLVIEGQGKMKDWTEDESNIYSDYYSPSDWQKYYEDIHSVIIGNGIKELNDETFGYCFYVKDIYCYAEIPPILGSNNFTTSAKLHVPAKSIDLYKNAYRWESWDHFGKIVALTDSDPKPTGIINIKTDAQNEEMYYDLLGRRVSEPSKGLYIINGKKVLMK